MFEKELKEAINAGLKAKDGIMKYYRNGFVDGARVIMGCLDE